MNLRKYNNNLFEEISKTLVLEFDKDTNQYSLINNNTPGIFGLGDTKEEAVEEYLSALKDMILVSDNIKNTIEDIKITDALQRKLNSLSNLV